MVLVSPAAPQIVYAVSGISLLRSEDAGANWAARPRPDAVSAIRRIVIDPTNAEVLYALAGSALYRTEDGAANWTPLAVDAEVALGATGLLIDPHAPSTLYLTSDCSGSPGTGGVRRSTDRGVTWMRVADPAGSDGCTPSMTLDPASPSHLYRDERSAQQCESRTRGDAWNCSAGPLPVKRVAVDPTNPLTQYGTTPPGATWTGTLLTSSDGGEHWAVFSPEGLEAIPDDLAVDPLRGIVLAASSTSGLFRSDDHGLHWSRISSVPASATSLAVGGSYAFAATARGLYRAPLAALDSWTPLPTGDFVPRPLNVNALALDPTNSATIYLAATDSVGPTVAGSVWRSLDSGRVWARISPPEGLNASFVTVDGAGDFYAVDAQTLWHFSRSDGTWTSSPLTFQPSSLVANPRLSGWLHSGQYVSTDGGHVWEAVTSIDPLLSLTIAPTGFDLYASTTTGIAVSHNAGFTWQRLNGSPQVRRIAVAPSRPLTIYGASSSSFYRSDDGGFSWVSLGLPTGADLPLVVDPQDDRSVWLGLQHSTDGGLTWQDESSDLPVLPSEVAIDRDGRTLHVLMLSTHWSATLRGTHRRAVD
jgi:photosystem II stability/assembly factor-like uncharacterized protein